ncbi:MAG: hypothetical protein D6717_11050 [Gammaproteobacteria bacterium]|nr:MAG: hypothetical protein D6717_11050 [Gammaproteobacteria bacterium]
MSTQDNQPALHGAIVSMVSLAAGIASNHPRMGLCQVERLVGLGIPRHQIEAVIEIARHIRDEASEQLDARFNEAWQELAPVEEGGCCSGSEESATSSCCGGAEPARKEQTAPEGEACCTPTPSGQPCC